MKQTRKEALANQVCDNASEFLGVLSNTAIDYDKAEKLILENPEIVKDFKCSYKNGGLYYQVPPNMHRDIQACDLRAISILCMGLSPQEFEQALTHLNRRNKHFLRGAWMRYQNAKRTFAMA